MEYAVADFSVSEPTSAAAFAAVEVAAAASSAVVFAATLDMLAVLALGDAAGVLEFAAAAAVGLVVASAEEQFAAAKLSSSVLESAAVAVPTLSFVLPASSFPLLVIAAFFHGTSVETAAGALVVAEVPLEAEAVCVVHPPVLVAIDSHADAATATENSVAHIVRQAHRSASPNFYFPEVFGVA